MLMAIRTVPAIFVVFSLSVAPVNASGNPPATKGGNPHTTITKSHAANTTKPTTPPAKTSHGNPHSTTTGSPKTTTTSKKGTTTSGTTTSSTTGPTTDLNPIAQKISSKPNLSSKLQTMLPKDMTLNQASQGFKNQGQFIAALHVSQNLKIPFAELKTAMTGIDPTLPAGTTQQPAPTMSLGQAIQKLRPSADADGAVSTAEHQASTDLSSTTTTVKTPKKKPSK
jgi:hypothetical protein